MNCFVVGNFRVEPPGLFIGRGSHPGEWFIRSQSTQGEFIKAYINGSVVNLTTGTDYLADKLWHHIALVKGKINSKKPVLVRVHALNFLTDILGSSSFISDNQIEKAMYMISKKKNGVVVVNVKRYVASSVMHHSNPVFSLSAFAKASSKSLIP